MGADDQITTVAKIGIKSCKHLNLSRVVKIGESSISTQYQVERTVRKLFTKISLFKLHAEPEGIA